MKSVKTLVTGCEHSQTLSALLLTPACELQIHTVFQDLRHSFATTALQSGVDVKTVSTMPGHSSAGFTLDVYTHSTSRMQQEAAQAVGNVMPKMLER